MEKRLQHVNGDTVLEITQPETVKVRLSEQGLLRRKTYLEAGITKFTNELAETNEKLAQIHAERDRKPK
jgi:hypothetical protein